LYIAPLAFAFGIGRIRFAHLFFDIEFRDLRRYALFENYSVCGEKMSKKTVSQMEAELMDKIQKAQEKLEALQQKHKTAIGDLAYKYNLHQFDMQQLDLIFSKISGEHPHGHI